MNLFNNFSKYKNNIALVNENNEIINYHSLSLFIEKFITNIKKRYLVFLICNNNLETIIGYLGFIKSNCVTTLIDEKTNDYFLLNIISKYKPHYIFISNKKKISLKGYSTEFVFYNYSLLRRTKEIKIKLHNDLMLLMSTSGSTGSTKFVRQSYTNLVSNTKSISNFLNISELDNAITTLPMSYVYGLSVINTHLENGGSITLNNLSIIQKGFWERIYKNKVTNFAGVPYTYEIIDKLDLKKFNLKFLKYTTQAGGKIPIRITKNIISKYEKSDIKLIIMYGASEATARMTYLSWKDVKKKPESIGKAIPGGKIWLENKFEKKINLINENGELIYKGKNVSLGYATNLKDLNKGNVNNLILRTGDIGYKDKDGYFYLVGRKDRFIKINGLRVNLSEVEDIILKMNIKSMCLKGEPNKILIYIKEQNKIKILKKNLSKSLNMHPSSFTIQIIKEFPLNMNYKTSYKKLEID
tara:strand:- start:42 stop:1451 length:1410 start_codon:yes stop_codon:yes gene_type:complete